MASRFLLLSTLIVQASADATSSANAAVMYKHGELMGAIFENAVLIREQMAAGSDTQGTVNKTGKLMDAMLSYFAPKVNGTFTDHDAFTHPMSANGVSGFNFFTAMEAASSYPDGSARLAPFNVRIAHVSANGTTGFAWYRFDVCGLVNETCVPGATVHDAVDMVMFTFDKDHKITGYYDWWEEGTIAKVDSLLGAVSLSSKKVTVSSLELPFLPTMFAVSAVITCFLVFALVNVYPYLGKKGGQATDSQEYSALLLA